MHCQGLLPTCQGTIEEELQVPNPPQLFVERSYPTKDWWIDKGPQVAGDAHSYIKQFVLACEVHHGGLNFVWAFIILFKKINLILFVN